MTKKDPRKNLRPPFPPGVSGNPSGKPKGLLTNDKVLSVIGKFADMSRAQLQEVIANPKTTMLEVTVASILAQAAKNGDYSRLEFLLSRTIGKVKDQIEISSVKPYLIARPDGSVLELGSAEVKQIEGEKSDDT